MTRRSWMVAQESVRKWICVFSHGWELRHVMQVSRDVARLRVGEAYARVNPAPSPLDSNTRWYSQACTMSQRT